MSGRIAQIMLLTAALGYHAEVDEERRTVLLRRKPEPPLPPQARWAKVFHPRGILPLPEDVAHIGDRPAWRELAEHANHDPDRMARAQAKRDRKAARRLGANHGH